MENVGLPFFGPNIEYSLVYFNLIKFFKIRTNTCLVFVFVYFCLVCRSVLTCDLTFVFNYQKYCFYTVVIFDVLFQIPSVEPKRILMFFNQFVTQSVQLLNKFATISDVKLEELNHRLQRIEATLSILEAKVRNNHFHKLTLFPDSLHCIWWNGDLCTCNVHRTWSWCYYPFDSHVLIIGFKILKQIQLSSVPVEVVSLSVPSSSEPEPEISVKPAVTSDAPVVRQVEEPVIIPPEILRFSKMLQVGVPLMAVEQKMRSEGLDPALLRSCQSNPVPSPIVKHVDTDDSESDTSLSNQDD